MDERAKAANDVRLRKTDLTRHAHHFAKESFSSKT